MLPMINLDFQTQISTSLRGWFVFSKSYSKDKTLYKSFCFRYPSLGFSPQQRDIPKTPKSASNCDSSWITNPSFLVSTGWIFSIKASTDNFKLRGEQCIKNHLVLSFNRGLDSPDSLKTAHRIFTLDIHTNLWRTYKFKLIFRGVLMKNLTVFLLK